MKYEICSYHSDPVEAVFVFGYVDLYMIYDI